MIFFESLSGVLDNEITKVTAIGYSKVENELPFLTPPPPWRVPDLKK